jgi:hypothetical protein
LNEEAPFLGLYLHFHLLSHHKPDPITQNSTVITLKMATTAPSIQEKTAGPVKTPLTAPLPTSVPKEHPALTPDQKKSYDWLLSHIQAWKTVPSKAAPGPLTDSEILWLTRDCLLRYLRATKWNEQEASKRLLDTLAWRRDYGVEGLTWEHISPENETGKQILLGFDNEGRPCHYLNPGRQNTDVSPRQTQHLVFMVERVIELMPAGQETLALLINFKTSKSRSNTAPGITQGREVLNILQTHYPERLGKALIINGKFDVTLSVRTRANALQFRGWFGASSSS